MTDEKIREIAESIYAALDGCDYTRTGAIGTIATVLRDSFRPVPGSVEVEIAVGVGTYADGAAMICVEAQDEKMSAEEAKTVAWLKDDTHRAIVRASIPPVSVPVVDGQGVGE